MNSRIAVIGAGAFGGWTALHLLRQGARVVLIDAWGAGNSRASSGGETRVIRAIYGPDVVYVRMAARALHLWRENEARWKQKLYHQTGALWMVKARDTYVQSSLPFLREYGLACEELTPLAAGKKYPQINLDGIVSLLLEKNAGYLTARRACEAVLEGFLSEGGEYLQAFVQPPVMEGGELREIKLHDGCNLRADKFVFACGAWMGTVCPEVADLIYPTRQEVFFFGTPAGDVRFSEENMPVCMEKEDNFFYAIPGNQWRGFKVADDTHGPPFDPTGGDRVPSAPGIQSARSYLAYRFPALQDAPLLEARVCQYENTPDGHFILDRHPAAANVWLAGGGSGHGFKHGPVVGEMLSEMVLADKPGHPFFALSRFAG